MNTEELILKLIETIENLAPQVWNVLVKQAYAEAISDSIYGIISLIACVLLIKLTVWCFNMAEDDDDYAPFGISSLLASLITGALFLINTTSAIMKFYNPEFYAIQLILEQIGR